MILNVKEFKLNDNTGFSKNSDFFVFMKIVKNNDKGLNIIPKILNSKIKWSNQKVKFGAFR